MNYKDYIKEKEKNKIMFDHYNKYIPLNSIWPDIIFNGDYSYEKINKTYQKENEIKTTKQKNLFFLIGNWKIMKKEQFKTAIDIVNYEFKNAGYLHPGEILHYLNIMILFCEWKLIERTRDVFFEHTKKIITQFKDKMIPINDWGMIEFEYGGWGYTENVPEIREMRLYLKNISNENLYIAFKTIIEKELEDMKNDVRSFCQNIIHVNETNKYYRKPFLYLVDINKFFHILIDLPVDEQSMIIYSFEERYGMKYSNGTLYKEYREDKENLMLLLKLYDESLGDIEYDPCELLKRDISKRLNELVDYFNKQIVYAK